VATPIGHLADITFRAVDTLRQADLIAAEDTRETGKLLRHYQIETPMVSCHEHNETARIPDFISRLEQGQSIALVSDAGSPGVSDPGFALVRATASAGLPVVPIPGPSAAMAGLMASGLPTDGFVFMGFLPRKGSRRISRLNAVRDLPLTLIFYESPRRIGDLIADLTQALGERPAVLCRELTKIHEEFLRGTLLEIGLILEGRPAVKGECTLLVGGAPESKGSDPEDMNAEIAAALSCGAVSLPDLARDLARKHHLKRNAVYQHILDIKEKE